MTRKEKTIKRIAAEENLDPRVIKLIVDSVIKFTRDKITDPVDTRSVMIPYFCKFVPKPKLTNGDVNKFNYGK